eukprot:TRINITY_DN3237_c0_g1_i1.p1 TRINITY_DN3237_c0_g1~~TRINITY_DN3237_c0_g1_i1.p1  ORF type:complete len:845 (-),score=181.90 TRINITY_DN3237_c0_g1_i1:6-2540(-)
MSSASPIMTSEDASHPATSSMNSERRVYSIAFMMSLQSHCTERPEGMPDIGYQGPSTPPHKNNNKPHTTSPRMSSSSGGLKHSGEHGRHNGGRRNSKVAVNSEPVVPLAVSKDRWVRPDATDERAEVYRKVKGILNKLTLDNFSSLALKLSQIHIDSVEVLREVTRLVFEKAISEPNFSPMYGELCKRLSDKYPEFTIPGQSAKVTLRRILLASCQAAFENRSVSDVAPAVEAVSVPQAEPKESADQPPKPLNYLSAATTTPSAPAPAPAMIAPASTSTPTATPTPPADTLLTPEELEYKHKRRVLGNIKFIGGLFKLGMLTENIMHQCIRRLLRSNGGIIAPSPYVAPSPYPAPSASLPPIPPLSLSSETPQTPAAPPTPSSTPTPTPTPAAAPIPAPSSADVSPSVPDEESLESLCKLLRTVGKFLDAKDTAPVDEYFAQLNLLAHDSALPSRHRFMIQDVLEQRAHNWVPRHKENDHKTNTALRAEAEMMEKLMSSRPAPTSPTFLSSSGNLLKSPSMPPTTSPAHGGRGRLSQSGGLPRRNSSTPQPASATEANGRGKSRGEDGWEVKGKARQGDRGSAPAKGRGHNSTNGHRSHSSRNDGRSQSGGERKEPVRAPNAFSALMNDSEGSSHGDDSSHSDGSDEPRNAGAWRTSIGGSALTSSSSSVTSTPITPEQIDNRTSGIMEEYFESADVNEATEAMREALEGTTEHGAAVVNRILSIGMESKQQHRERVPGFLAALHRDGLLSEDDCVAGFLEVMGIIDDLEVDIPGASTFVAICINKLVSVGAVKPVFVENAFSTVQDDSKRERLVQLATRTDDAEDGTGSDDQGKGKGKAPTRD